MSDQDTTSHGSLVPAGRRDLAPVAVTNPLVARGLADLAQGRSRKVCEAVPSNLHNALFYYNRGLTWLEENDTDKAIKDFDEAIRLLNAAIHLDPNNAFTHVYRGKAWLGKDTAWSSTDEFEAWLSTIEEDDYETLSVYFREAIKDFDEAIRLDSSCGSTFLERGQAWRFQDDEKAIKDFNEAIRLDPRNASFYCARGRAWSRKDGDKAIRDFNEAIRLDPTCVSAYVDRGKCWMAKQDYDRAISD